MFKNYLKITLRNLVRHKAYTFINIAGLAIGLACCIVIFLFVRSESGYDQYHQNKHKVYRMTIDVEGLSSGDVWKSATSSILWGPALKQDYPEIKDFCRVMEEDDDLIFEYAGQKYTEQKIVYADKNVFSFFTWPFVYGDPQTALAEPFNVVITRSMAQKYFGEENPLGKVLLISKQERTETGELKIETYPSKVTGVIEDIPYKSHLKPGFIVSFITLNDFFEADVTGGVHPHDWFWRGRLVHSYLMLPENARPQELEAKFPAFLDKYVGEATTSRGYAYHPYLQPLAEIHLEGQVYGTFEPGGNKDQLVLFAVIALFVLLIACINFMNLSTARSVARAKEVGVRKAVGANRKRLIRQFMGEAILMSFLALLLALLLVEMINPLFYKYLGKEFYFDRAERPLAIAGVILIALLAGMLAGSYPAFLLSRFQPVQVLKGSLSAGSGGRRLRKALVVAQFFITVFFIVGTLTLYYQLQFMQSKDLGFNQSQVVVIPPEVTRPVLSQLEAYRNEFLANAGIEGVTISSSIPGRSFGGDVWGEKGRTGEEGVGMSEFEVDYDFIDFYGLELLAGRNFDREMGTDAAPPDMEESGYELAAIVNETAVKRFGWESAEYALGRYIVRDPVSNDFTGKIIGVVKDFHFESLREPIGPAVFYINPNYARIYRFISVRISPGDIAGTLQFIRDRFKQNESDTPFQYFFADENFAKLYENDRRMVEVYGYVSLLTILIACLGLFGLASYTAAQRTKEIGIRKVLGSSVFGIITLLSKDFLKLVVLGFIIAVPAGYYVMNRWLEDFAYRIDIDAGIFLLAGVIALLIALATVSYQAVKAALANPVEALRYE